MIEIGAFEAKNHLSTLLDALARGEEMLITRRGKLAAGMSAYVPAQKAANWATNSIGKNGKPFATKAVVEFCFSH